MNLEDELGTLNYLIKKKRLNYNEFNEVIGNYFVIDYEELEDNYYLINIISPLNSLNCEGSSCYTDYIELINI